MTYEGRRTGSRRKLNSDTQYLACHNPMVVDAVKGMELASSIAVGQIQSPIYVQGTATCPSRSRNSPTYATAEHTYV
jgi:hypothetical protein